MRHFSPPLELDLDSVAAALRRPQECSRPFLAGRTASVLFLIHRPPGRGQGPLLILNKRSALVRQPGDLCCPGGTVHPALDRLLGLLLWLPPFFLWRDRGWKAWRGCPGQWKRLVATYWACCLRESWEEMRLPPWKVELLGLLPAYRLKMFERNILPMVGSMSGYSRFRVNWEVERIVPIPLSSLLDPANYGKYILSAEGGGPYPGKEGPAAFPCFVHEDEGTREILWGATYHIVLSFLSRVWGFEPPPLEQRPVLRGTLPGRYLSWNRSNGEG